MKIPREGHGNPLQYSCLENPHGQRILAGYNSRGRKESDTTERLSTAQHSWCQKRKETTERAGLHIILIRFNQLAISLSHFKSGKVRRLQLRFKVLEYLSQSKLCLGLSFLRSLLSLFVRMGNSYTFHPFSYTSQPFQWADSLSVLMVCPHWFCSTSWSVLFTWSLLQLNNSNLPIFVDSLVKEVTILLFQYLNLQQITQPVKYAPSHSWTNPLSH